VGKFVKLKFQVEPTSGENRLFKMISIFAPRFEN